MKTRYEQMTAGGAVADGYHNFLGDDPEYREWIGFLGQHRGSDCLERSNFRKGLEAIGGEGENVRVERFWHWAVGWVEEIYIRPGTEEEKRAEEIVEKLEGYPVLDDDDFSSLEQEEADEVWKNCYSVKSRIEYMRENEKQFEFRSFSDMRSQVRGEYFGGRASELIS